MLPPMPFASRGATAAAAAGAAPRCLRNCSMRGCGFRGSLSGVGFAYCDFVRRDRPVIAAAEAHQQLRHRPRTPRAETEASASKPDTVAAPTTPVEKKDLPTVTGSTPAEPLELRSTTR